MNIQCQVCKQTFLQTTKAPAYVLVNCFFTLCTVLDRLMDSLSFALAFD